MSPEPLRRREPRVVLHRDALQRLSRRKRAHGRRRGIPPAGIQIRHHELPAPPGLREHRVEVGLGPPARIRRQEVRVVGVEAAVLEPDRVQEGRCWEPSEEGVPGRERREALGGIDLHQRRLGKRGQPRPELGRRGRVPGDAVVCPVVENRPPHGHPDANADDRARPRAPARDPGREGVPDAEQRPRARAGDLRVHEAELDGRERRRGRVDRVDRQRRAAQVEPEVVGERAPRRVDGEIVHRPPEEGPVEHDAGEEVRRVAGGHVLHRHLEVGREADRPDSRRRPVRETEPQVEVRAQGVERHDGAEIRRAVRPDRVGQPQRRAPGVPAVAKAGPGPRESAAADVKAGNDGAPLTPVRSRNDPHTGASVAQLEERAGPLRERQPVDRGLKDEDAGGPVVEADGAPRRGRGIVRVRNRTEQDGDGGQRRPEGSPHGNDPSAGCGGRQPVPSPEPEPVPGTRTWNRCLAPVPGT